MSPDPRWFTLEEANRLLPQVRQTVLSLRGHRDRLQELERMKAVEELAWLREDGTVSPKAQETLARLDEQQRGEALLFEKELQQLHETGVELKDLEEGLVDFFARRGTEQVYLCWKDGEDRIRYWHDLLSGFSGRRPIEEF